MRQKGYDAVAVTEVERKGFSDEEQLRYATTEDRAILTHNIRDFAPLAQECANQSIDHSGIIVAYQLSKGELLSRTLVLIESTSAEQLHNTLRFL